MYRLVSTPSAAIFGVTDEVLTGSEQLKQPLSVFGGFRDVWDVCHAWDDTALGVDTSRYGLYRLVSTGFPGDQRGDFRGPNNDLGSMGRFWEVRRSKVGMFCYILMH